MTDCTQQMSLTASGIAEGQNILTTVNKRSFQEEFLNFRKFRWRAEFA